MIRRQRVVEMAEMGDAEAGNLENENGISGKLGRATITDIGRHIAHPHIPFLNIEGRCAALMRPAPEHMLDRGVGR